MAAPSGARLPPLALDGAAAPRPASADPSRLARRRLREAALEDLQARKAREGGLRPEHATALEALFDMTRKPDADAMAHVAAQLGVTEHAVMAWFRNKRVEEKRSAERQRRVVFGGVIAAVLIAVLIYLYTTYDPAESGRSRRANLRKSHSSRVRQGVA